MTFDTAYMITALVTMFVVIDPIAIAPVFLALTRGMSNAQRRKIAWRAVGVAGLILLIFAAFGEAVLGFIGISMPAFRVAGGILLFITALDMLFDRRTKRREDRADEDDHDDPSVFPMAIPLIAGPGSIASVILLTGEKPGGEGLLTMIVITALIGGAGSMVGMMLGHIFPILLATAFVVGGMSNPLYSLIMAHTNDFLEHEDMASASGGMLFINGLGAVLGPVITGWMMGTTLGPGGFYLFTAVLFAALAGYASYRKTQRAAVPVEDTGNYVPIYPSATAVAVEIAQEYVIEAEQEAAEEAAQKSAEEDKIAHDSDNYVADDIKRD
ncbi:hypothetical protein LCGC14_1320530 [marine sediment metagenome]|uniref:Uncharacterized protein n=1 Tax=marine sediment metagenome TaxID=412755 RepID=A0A0F9KJQ7_9ZZZZ